MKLTTHDNRKVFTLHVERYEFPDEELKPTDDNPADDFEPGRFLMVAHEWTTGDRGWRVCRPTMKTTELLRFAEWLESIQGGCPSAESCYFTERDLEFTFDSQTNAIVVHLSGELLPPGNVPTVSLEFPVDDIQLNEAVESIWSQMTKFPGRPIPG